MSLSRAQNIFMPADINSIEIREMVSFELGKEIDKGVFFVLSRARDKEKILSPHEESNRVPRSWRNEKNTFLYFFTELKTYYPSYFNL